MRKTFIDGKEKREKPVDTLSVGFLEARDWNNKIVSGRFGHVTYSENRALDFKIHVRQFEITASKPVTIEIIDSESVGVFFFLSVFDSFTAEWDGLPKRLFDEGSYGVLHMQPEKFKATLEFGSYAMYRIELPLDFMETFTIEHNGFANFFANSRGKEPKLLFTEQDEVVPWEMIRALKDFIDSPTGQAERAFILSYFLDGSLRHLIRKLIEEIPEPVEIPDNLRMFEKAANLMRADPTKDFHLDELAAKAGMSKTYFTTGFRQLYSQSPMEYLRRLRMQKVVLQLLTTEDTVEKVAINSGYNDEPALIKALKKKFGVSPAGLRGKKIVR